MIIAELIGHLIEVIVLRIFRTKPFGWNWFMWMTKDAENRECAGIITVLGIVAIILMLIGVI